MLSPEEARARIEAIRVDGWRDDARRRVKRIPRQLREPMSLLLEEPSFPTLHSPQRNAELLKAFRTLEGSSDKDLRSALRAVHPGLGVALALWWRRSTSQPYTQRFDRRAFRAPKNPEVTLGPRGMLLEALVRILGPFPEADPAWVAAWAPHLNSEAVVGGLLATAIDAGGSDGQAVFDTLIASGNGEHAVGAMGRHVVVGLWRSARPDGWDYVERMLLSAQRQEGLRQVILEAADEAHPDAFRRLLHVLLDHDLLRFAAAIRAVSVWVGCELDVERKKDAASFVEQLVRDLDDAKARADDIQSGDGVRTCIGLLASAMTDAVATVSLASRVLRNGPPDARTASALVLSQLGLRSAQQALVPALADPDLRVAWLALGTVQSPQAVPQGDPFDGLLALAARLPERPREIGPFVFAGAVRQVGRAPVLATAIRQRGSRPLDVLIPWLPAMDPSTRVAFARAAAEGNMSAAVRAALLDMAGDRSSTVRRYAVEALKKVRIDAGDAAVLEPMLTRTATDLRRGIITLLASLRERDALASANRLWHTESVAQRDAGCELLGALARTNAVERAAAQFRGDNPTKHQLELLEQLTDEVDNRSPLDAIFDPAERTPAVQPTKPRAWKPFLSEAGARIPGALDDLVYGYRDVEVEVVNWQGSTEMLLADVQWLRDPLLGRHVLNPSGAPAPDMVLGDTLRTWWNDRPSELREADGQEAVRALAAVLAARPARRPFSPVRPNIDTDWAVGAVRSVLGNANIGELRLPHVVMHALAWVVYEEANEVTVADCLDAAEALLSLVPASAVRALPDQGAPVDWRVRMEDFRPRVLAAPWFAILYGLVENRSELFDDERLARLFGLNAWLSEPRPGVHRLALNERLILRAHRARIANRNDLIDALLVSGSRLLTEMTLRRRRAIEAEFPEAVAVVDELRDAIVQTEVARGDLPTPVSGFVRMLSSIEGADVVMQLLSSLGALALRRGYLWGDDKAGAISHLVRVSYPAATDTAATVAAAAAKHKVNDRRLIELAVYAPQWAQLVEQVLDWQGLADGVWWIHAHTKDVHWQIGVEVKETWAALSAERTPLSSSDLIDGAVDVAWFWRMYETLGAQRWAKLYRAGKLASGGNGHRRAQVFADALLGASSEASVVERIRDKRNQDAVRALGLLPLPESEVARRETLLARYRVMREFERGSAKFGNQRRANERTAARIGVENLARGAGYDDSQRFVWAMEAEEISDLRAGPVTVEVDGVELALSVDVEGQPQFAVSKGGRTLKSVPAKLRKDAHVVALRERRTQLARQASRVRASLEESMIAGRDFSPDELNDLAQHPIVGPMLNQLLFVDDRGSTYRRTGEGAFVGADEGERAPSSNLRIAHPVDMWRERSWSAWQQWLFHAQRRQPLRQVFRELYVVTETERQSGPASSRYEGHQVQPRTAQALFGTRGWNGDYDAGVMSRVFHSYDLVARVDFLGGFLTPAEVELPTLRSIWFTRRGGLDALPLDSVAPIVFSEAMRDLDLVVSVAHAGGVDPEATASTIEMREALARETARVMKLDNVEFVGNHAVITGKIGEYSIHLGSGVVHRRPGGAVCVVPVHSQRRGRIFLPFADDDPKSAEVLSKLLLFARDHEIRDPTILEQLRAG